MASTPTQLPGSQTAHHRPTCALVHSRHTQEFQNTASIVALAFWGAPLGAIRGRGRSEEGGKHRQRGRILSRASIGTRTESRAKGDGPATGPTQDNHCKLRNCHNQMQRTESNPYNPWTGSNHQVSRVGWDEESSGDEGGHLHQGPHLILKQGVAHVWWSTW